MLSGNNLVADRVCIVTSPSGVAGICGNSTTVCRLPAGTTLAYQKRPSPAMVEFEILDGQYRGGMLGLWLGDIQRLS